jgi:sulfopropanediol 3-dehydrogenase
MFSSRVACAPRWLYRGAKSAARSRSESTVSNVADVVSGILGDVRQGGNAALDKYCAKFDRVPHKRLTEADVEECLRMCTGQEILDIKYAQGNIARFAKMQRDSMKDVEVETQPGVFLGHKHIPIKNVGCYVPGGKFPMIASAHMSVLTAKTAGCDRVIACTAPMPGGEPGRMPHTTIAAMHHAGADEIYLMGGAQAIAAMAFGTETIQPVDFIAGPGNAFVAEAKKQVFGRVGIDLIAGPTETLLLCDDSVDSEITAADLLGQAEHGYNTPAILVTTSEKLAHETIAKVDAELERIPTAETAGVSWKDYGEVIVVDDDKEMLEVAEEICGEHVQVMHRDWAFFKHNLRNYGGLFLGVETNVAYGDKVIGTNHTLPTQTAGRYTGGLWVGKFIKTHTYQHISKEASVEIGDYCSRLCGYENFAGHKEQADVRLRRWKPGYDTKYYEGSQNQTLLSRPADGSA